MTRWDRIAGWALVAVATFGVWGALRLPIGRPSSPEPGFVPLVEAILLGLSGMALIGQASRASSDKTVSWPTAEARRMVLHLAIALSAYVLLLSVLGFVPSTFLFVLVAVRAWRRYSLWVSAAYAVGVTILLQLTFRVALSMPLPQGLLGFF
jgi:putative tricarboxylic transport membrane protein